MSESRTVVILGASDKPERYSNRAQKLLSEQGYVVVPVHPSTRSIEGVLVFGSLAEAKRHPDALTVYVKPETGSMLVDEIVSLAPSIVILNPGAENPALESALDKARIPYIHACTVMLLTTGRFESVVFHV
ncbi:MAG: CoA-binding protein [Candidatus Moraniibacteriota bacterium]